jgi:RimJ/RimL family protein N-acetyltransferase
MFETERLYVRHFQPDDLDMFAALCADPQVMRFVGDGELLPREMVKHWIDVCQQKYATRGYGTSAVFEKAGDKFIGYCGVVRAPENDFDELIYVFNVEAWGKGYATEVGRAMLQYVFEHSTLDRIYATIHPDNAASIKVAGKMGFSFQRTEIDPDGMPVSFFVIERI